MKILHTSDWHLGRSLYGRKRYTEFEHFLDWLADYIETQSVDALLVAGDLFDTSAPSNRAQALYYRFLCRIAASACRHVVIIAGNHDSPSFLNAPRELLLHLNVHVIGAACEAPADEVLLLRHDGKPELIVCAVPYLRDRDIRSVEAGESLEDKERKLVEGIRAHYALVGERARQLREEHSPDLPIIGMGHLFTAGAKTLEGDGVRELYVGSLAHVGQEIFPDCLDYLALGHLHVPQVIGGHDRMRYSGSPLPMGFGEAKQQKSLCLLDCAGGKPGVQLTEIPRFQELERIQGDWDSIAARLTALAATGSKAWLEIIYNGGELAADLRGRLDAAIAGTDLEILRVKNTRAMERGLEQLAPGENLMDLDESSVFERALQAFEVPPEQMAELHVSYQEILRDLHELDGRAD